MLSYSLTSTLIAVLLFMPWGDGSPPGAFRIYLALASVLGALLYGLGSDPELTVGRWIKGPGALPWLLAPLMIPYRSLAWSILYLKAALSGENPQDEIRPGLYLGRRPLLFDRARLRALGPQAIVDLCAEFPASGALAGLPETAQLLVPVLDGGAPSLAQIHGAVRWVEDRLASGDRVLVHCAVGHGRSASIVAALLLARREARTVDQAEELLRSLRPRIRLSGAQRVQLDRFLRSMVPNP